MSCDWSARTPKRFHPSLCDAPFSIHPRRICVSVIFFAKWNLRVVRTLQRLKPSPISRYLAYRELSWNFKRYQDENGASSEHRCCQWRGLLQEFVFKAEGTSTNKNLFNVTPMNSGHWLLGNDPQNASCLFFAVSQRRFPAL